MPVPSSVTVALSSDEVRVLREAADVLGVPLERLLAAAAATFARSLRQFRHRALVDLVALMGNYAATAALLTVFDMQLDPDQTPLLPLR